MLRFFILILLILSVTGSLFAKELTKELTKELNRVVGLVGNEVVTSRDVKTFHIIESAVNEKKVELKSLTDVNQLGPLVSDYLLSSMVYKEALVFKGSELAETDFKKEELKVTQLLRDRPDIFNLWKGLAVSLEERNSMIKKKIIARNFLDLRAQANFASVSEVEAKNYYEQNRRKFGGADFSQVKENVVKFLSRRYSENRLKDWLSILQKKYGVRHLALDLAKQNN